MTDKEAILRQIYYDKETGFGSIFVACIWLGVKRMCDIQKS